MNRIQFYSILCISIILSINCSSISYNIIDLSGIRLKQPVYFGRTMTRGLTIEAISKKRKIRKLEAYDALAPGSSSFTENFYEPRGGTIVHTKSVLHSGTRSEYEFEIDTILKNATKEGFVILPVLNCRMDVSILAEGPAYYEATMNGYCILHKKRKKVQ
ncbi:hypothetical protein JXJ21_08990 [candidate division KSB1 bacterium]|nr:hypothetical protein [candidate division KSB1 bacterium]